MKKRKNEAGFTLLEMLVVLALTVLIVASATGAISMISTSISISTDQSTALFQVQNAGFWISRDARTAQTIITGVAPELVTFEWVGWDSQTNLVRYYFEGNALLRQLNGGTGVLIADYMDVGSTDATWNPVDWLLTFHAQASSGETTVQRTYEVSPRP